MTTSLVGFRCVKVVALPVSNLVRANKFYGETLGLEPAYEESKQVGYSVGETTLMLKPDWDLEPNSSPNPRVTIETDNALQTQKVLLDLKVTVADPVQLYDNVHYVGSFLDSEGNKLWFCSFAV